MSVNHQCSAVLQAPPTQPVTSAAAITNPSDAVQSSNQTANRTIRSSTTAAQTGRRYRSLLTDSLILS